MHAAETYWSSRVLSKARFFAALLAIKAMGVVFATMIFSKYSPLVDSQHYLSGFYATTREYRTFIVQWLAIEANNFGGPFVAHFMFAFLSVLGLVYYYATGGRRWVLLLTLFFPSSLVWTSIVGKEALYCGAMGLALVIWSKYTCRPLRWHEAMIAAGSLAFCFVSRPHYAIAVLWLYVATFVINRFGKRASFVLLFLLFSGTLAAYFLVWDELLSRAYSGIDATARASRFGLLGIVPETVKGFLRFKSIVPLGVIISIIGPLPSEMFRRPEFIPFFVEGVLILLSPLLLYSMANRYNIPDRAIFVRFYWWCLMPAIAISMIMHAPFGLLNPGSATRWRTNFEQLFYLAPLLLMYRFKDEAT